MPLHHALRGALVGVSLSALASCGAPTEGDEPLYPSPQDADPSSRGAPDPSAPGDDDLVLRVDRPRALPRGPSSSDNTRADPEVPSNEGSQPSPPVSSEEPDVPEPAVPPAPMDPTAPIADGGVALPWPDAPWLEGVTVTRNYDSVTVSLPAVAGAHDYRAFLLTDDVSLEISDDGAERVSGTTVHCAGHEQHNAPATDVRVPVRRIDVTGVRGPARIVVEALDTTCPFAGVMGAVHEDIEVTNYALADSEKVPFSIYTEDEVRALYGSLVVNGHRRGPALGAPANDVPPKVLARTTLDATPKTGAAPVSDFFSGFGDDADQPVYVGELPSGGRVPYAGQLHENSDFTFTTYAEAHTQFFIDRGQLHMVLADWEQDVFGSAVAHPKRAATMHDDSYVHVTYEVPSNATQRRYWWLSLCGASEPGQTLDDNGHLMSSIIQTPFFYQNDGRNPSLEKWSCLQVFPRDGLPDALAPTGKRPETDVRVMVNAAGGGDRDSVRNVSPRQYPNGYTAASWYRQRDADGDLTAPILDDEQHVGQKARYDVYVGRHRVVVYVNGEQRLCNDFPSTPLTMAEAAVGFGLALYHSAAERVEFSREFNDRTGQRYYLENTPYVDARAWDNLGFDEDVQLPAGFDPSVCYVHEG